MKNVFLLSAVARDPLAAEISSLGWRVSSARRPDRLKNRFLSANALVALVDLRENEEVALAAISEIAAISEEHAIAIVGLANVDADSEIVLKSYEAGATHFHHIDGDKVRLDAAIKFGFRYAEQRPGTIGAAQDFNKIIAQTDQSWELDKSKLSQSVVSDGLKEKFPDIDFEKYPATGIFRTLSDEEKSKVRGAFGRLNDGSAQAAIPQKLTDGRILHHLHDSEDRIFGRIEQLSGNSGPDYWTERDILSGLRNSASLTSWIKSSHQDGNAIGLLSFGIRNFKTINAAYGRETGDELLRKLGSRLVKLATAVLNDNHTVARVDGQNFVVAVQLNRTIDELRSHAEKLLSDLFQPISIGDRIIQMTGRVGIVSSKPDNDESDAIKAVGLALTEAMASESNQIKLINDASGAQLALEQKLQSQLPAAMENGEIAILLQPQIRCDSGQLIGAEALARWDHPELGLIGAATLFAVADRAQLTSLLSAHIHEKAFHLAGKWPESLSFLRISVNVTAGDLAEPEFVDKILGKIAKAGFSARKATLEITETELISDMSGSVERLQQLRDYGLKIAIDDFGTGYSSLSYLKKLPLDYLKIDSALTADIMGSKKDQVVVRSIIEMARSLGLQVVAEGVESEAQLETLIDEGCEYFQGFLRSGPLHADEFEIFALRSN